MNGRPPDRPRNVADALRPRRRLAGVFLFAILAVAVLGGRAAVSYYVNALWFESLGYSAVFWTRVLIQAALFGAFALVTFLVLFGAALALKPARVAEMIDGTILINGQRVKLPVDTAIKWVALGLSLAVAAASGAGMMARWATLALFWHAPSGATAPDPIFGRPLSFYLFILPAWQLISGWLLTLAALVTAIAALLVVVAGGAQVLPKGRIGVAQTRLWRGLSISVGALLLILAARVYLGRFERLFQDGTVFTGVTYTDAHVTLTGTLLVCIALLVGAVMAGVGAISAPRLRWLAACVAPALVCAVLVGVVGWYVGSFDRIEPHAFPAETGIEAVEAANNQTTLENIRLWDVRALQDTLRQIQEIRTYYEFPSIDIDRYEVSGSVRQMMLAARELNVDKLPVSSRNWINEKLIYTHGYGVTMNPVNGFTPEGLPALVLSNMPIQSTIPGLKVIRPQIYFGELTNTDVYVNTHQKEFDYPQGDANSLTSYEGDGGFRLGGLLRRTLIAFDRGDVAKVPFSDDIGSESRLLMRRNVRERVQELAPFLTFDQDPYIVVGEDGRLYWLMDAFTTADTYPYARRYRLGYEPINYIRNSVKILIDAFTGATTFYVFDTQDPIIAAYRAVFPALFADASAMAPALRKHVRYPELMLRIQAAVYGLYHMSNPDVFYNREDLWSVATEAGSTDQRQHVMEPNFVLMRLPGERATEFIEILPFTPANRNNLIGWIAGRSDGEHYGQAVVYDFPKSKLIDGPLQIEARIDQNAQLSGQLTLWNQQGSHVRRGSLIVIPIGRALLYAEPIYLQAEHSPMPELRLVVLAVQDRLAYGPTFESAMAALFAGAESSVSVQASAAPPGSLQASKPRAGPEDVNALIAGAARDLSDYQQLTAEGKLGDAGQKLEALKRKLEALQRRR